jgi:hypothetical protein
MTESKVMADKFEVDDYVRANIEGRVIETRQNERGEQVVVEYIDNDGIIRKRALWITEIEPADEDDDGPEPDEIDGNVIPFRAAA